MFSAKYYDNPFADDDDDICYGEILSDQGDTVVNSSHSGHERCEKQPFMHTAGSPVPVSRRNAAESSSTEIPLSTVHNGDDWASSAHRGQVDNQDYEEYIVELRAELESANAENSRLTAAQTKAEARARGLLFDKENVEWQLVQEKERSRALAEKVAALEEELEQMASRKSDVAHRGGWTPGYAAKDAPHAGPPYRGHVDPHAPPPQPSHSREGSAVADLVSTPPPDKQRSTIARAQFQQRQAAYMESHGGSHERDGKEAAAVTEPNARQGSEPPHEVSQNSGLTRSLRGQCRADAVQEKILQQQKAADEQAAAVKGLEELLQTHCQKRDELATQLQRLESMRMRTVADKRKKAAVETSLEEEEKTIGRVRLELRSHSALLR